MMRLYEKKELCTGCRACEQICPLGAIGMVEDGEGFLYPQIDESKCVNCGMCKQACERIESKEEKVELLCYAAKNRVDELRERSSSGGVFYELACAVLELGGEVYGAAFDDEFQVMHKKITSVHEIPQIMGSKYVQSNTRSTFCEAKQGLENDKWVLYSGTPCQIAGLRGYLQKDYEKLLCVSLICHGVPSPMVWRKYLSYLKGRFDEPHISSIQFREKSMGWKNYSMKVAFDKYVYRADFRNDLYETAFLADMDLRPSCYSCRAKGDHQQADIILGDFWGIEKEYPDFEDRLGVSAVILNSIRGKEFFNKVADCFILKPTRYDVIKRNQPMLESSVKMTKQREKFFASLDKNGAFDNAVRENVVVKIIPLRERKNYQYDLIKRYLENKIAGRKISNVLEQAGYRNCVLYAIMDLTELLYQDMQSANNLESKVRITYVCDKGYQKFSNGYYGAPIIGLKELQERYHAGEIDGIVICNVYRLNEIMDELLACGIKQEHMMSAATLVHSM